MCYSPEVSIGTFAFVGAVCMFLWHRGKPIDKALTWILLGIASMQLIEFGLWTNLDCGLPNKIFSGLIPVVLWLQPLVIFISIWYYKVGWLRVYGWLIVIYVALLPWLLTKYVSNTTLGQCTKVGTCGFLQWPFINEGDTSAYFQYLYHTSMILGLGTLKSTAFSVFYVISSALSYQFTKKYYSDSWSSVWCHFVNLLAVGAVFLT
jgi:hypothetical protein